MLVLRPEPPSGPDGQVRPRMMCGLSLGRFRRKRREPPRMTTVGRHEVTCRLPLTAPRCATSKAPCRLNQ